MVWFHRRTRRRIAALLAPATLLLLGSSVLPAAAATTPVQVGLFGSQDPTYDGVFRQSLGLLAYAAAGQQPPPEAVTWLLGQQCPDGGFQAFRAVTTDPCQKSDPVAYSGEDTNSTGLAAAALRVVGQASAADRALAWALAAQNTDGGFPYFVGGQSDANSTAVVLFGSNTAHRSPGSVTVGGVSAADFLRGLQIGCEGAATDDDGGFAFQNYGSGLLDNDAASVQAVLALSGAGLPVPAQSVSSSVPRADCSTTPPPTPTATPAELGAGHIARVLDAFGGAIPQYDYNAGARVPGSVSLGDTAWAVLSLAAVGVGRAQLQSALGTLGITSPSAAALRPQAASASSDKPGELALTALAAAASGASGATVSAYVVRLGATMQVAPVASTPSTSPSPTASSSPTTSPTPSASSTPHASSTSPKPSSSDNGSLSPTGATPLTPAIAAVGAALLLLGAALLATGRRRGTHA